VREGGVGERKLRADVLVIDAPRSPSYELPEQAGASLVHEPSRGFVTRAPHGRIRQEGPFGVWVVGEVAGTPFDCSAIRDAADEVAEQVLRAPAG
jgi:hypothetical protein